MMVTLLMAKQIIIWGRPKNKKSSGVWIDKNSIGTVWINGNPITYNANLVYNEYTPIEKIVEDYEKLFKPKKRIIVIRRK